MEKNVWVISILTLFVGGFGGYFLANNCCGLNLNKNYDYPPSGMHRMSDGTMMNNSGSDSNKMMGMDHGMMMVKSEREFITEMIPHHQEAVDTAKEVLARGATTPEVKTLVENIIKAQEKEIADMKTWYKTWYNTDYQPSGKYQPMMRDLENLSGKELDKAFLEDMIMHHMGAIMMAESVQKYVEHNEIKDLTKAISTSQSDEINQMRVMLNNL